MTLAFSLTYCLWNYLSRGIPVKAPTLLDLPYAFYNLPILDEPRVLKSVLTPPNSLHRKQKTIRFVTTLLTIHVYKP